MSNKPQISQSRLITGTLVFILGFLSPLLIPLVTNTDWPVGVKSIISGLLAFGVPEVFMVLSVAIMGKPGYEFIKQKAFKLIQPLLPPDSVSLARYRLGLIMFSIPILFGLFEPYLAYYFDFFRQIPIGWRMSLDLLFLLSLFVLGGDFWDKLRGLFQHKARITTAEKEGSDKND